MENTPFYFYNLSILNETLKAVQENIQFDDFKIHYAIKANNNKKILEIMAEKGFGADCVSGWEIETALAAGFVNSSIVFAGVGKTDLEIRIALENKIGIIHCESLDEIMVIDKIAKEMRCIPNIALRLNPSINALTHAKISTGMAENKFGFTSLELAELIEILDDLKSVNILGLHFHIGSQITEMQVFEQLCEYIMEIIPFFEEKIGRLEYLNVGGGLGINYDNPDEQIIPEFGDYFDTFRWGLRKIEIPIHFELGRSLVGQCGMIRTKVLYVKRSEKKNFAIIDAGMTELIRPALYGAKHKIEKIEKDSNLVEKKVYDIVGPICEPSDSFGTNISLSELKRGDILNIRSCGAYAESMSLRYNGRQRVGNNLKRNVTTTLRKAIIHP